MESVGCGQETGINSEPGFDRIILKSSERSILDRWIAQIEKQYDGLIKVTKSDLMSFLIRNREHNLSDTEIKQLGVELYDEMRWINRAIEKVRQSKREGSLIRLEDLMAKRKPLERLKNKSKNKAKQPPGNNE